MGKAAWLLVSATMIICTVPSFAATIAEEYAAAQALIADSKPAEALPHLNAVLGLAANADLAALPLADVLAIAGTHKALAGIAYTQALAMPGLTPEQTKEARTFRSLVFRSQSHKIVGYGETVDIASVLVPGKTNIVDFFSKYCPPCMKLGPYLESLAAASDDLFLVKVDINRPGHQGIDWSSPVAQQFGLRSIPHLKIYGPDGKLQAEGEAARTRIDQLLRSSGL